MNTSDNNDEPEKLDKQIKDSNETTPIENPYQEWTTPIVDNQLPNEQTPAATLHENDSAQNTMNHPGSQGGQSDYQQPEQLYANSNKKQTKNGRSGAIVALILVVAVIFGVSAFAGWEFSQPHTNSGNTNVASSSTSTAVSTKQSTSVTALDSNNVNTTREAAIARIQAAVVQIDVTTAQGRGLGSGVIIDKNGYIVTNNHVVDGAQAIQVELASGTKVNAQVTGTDAKDDLAVIKIAPPTNITVANIADSSKLQVGEEVLAVGNPLGNTQTVTNGIVSALNRTINESNNTTINKAIQTDTPINPGNSGGALIDLQGNLVGIPTLAAIDQETGTLANGVGFAIPSNTVSRVVPQIIQSAQTTANS